MGVYIGGFWVKKTQSLAREAKVIWAMTVCWLLEWRNDKLDRSYWGLYYKTYYGRNLWIYVIS